MSYLLLKGELSEAVVSSVSLGQGDGDWDGLVEQKIQVHFCLYAANHPAETAQRRGRKFAGGAAGEEVITEQDNQADMDKLKIKPGKWLIPFATGKCKIMQTGIKIIKVIIASRVS